MNTTRRKKYKAILWNKDDFSKPIIVACIGKIVHEGTYCINTNRAGLNQNERIFVV